MTTRRTFLKLAGAAAVATGLAKAGDVVQYAEPLELLEEHGDWVEDRGDFYIVRVPDFKTFARETLRKPTIFLLGQMAVVADVAVIGFANIQVPKQGLVRGCHFDASKMRVGRERPTVEINSSSGMTMSDCIFQGGGTYFGVGTYKVQSPLIMAPRLA